MEPLVFLHNPKAGGTAVADLLRSAFGPGQVAPLRETSPHERDPAGWANLRQCRFVAGHFGYEVVEHHFPGHGTITNFRHPVSRVASLYDYWRSVAVSPTLPNPNGPAYASRLSFSEFIRDPSPFLGLYLEDFHTRQLVASGWLPATLGEPELERARGRIRALRWFYVCEREQDSLAWLAAVYPRLAAGRPLARVNVTTALHRTVPTAADTEVIASRNRHDLAVYEFAADLLRGRVAAGRGPRAAVRLTAQASVRMKNELTSREPS